MRSRSQKAEAKKIIVISARYVSNFTIAIHFSSGITRLVNFLPLFDRYVKGDNLKYFAPERFKKFIAKNGNIYWGRNEDVIFPVHLLLNQTTDMPGSKEEVLYVI